MSIAAMAHIWEHSQQAGRELLLMLAIADFANDQGVAWPSINTLARRTRTATRTVQRLLSRIPPTELEIQPNAGPNGTHLFRVVLHRNLALFPDTGYPQGGDNLSGGDKLSGVTKSTKRGDTAVSPEPSLTIILNNRRRASARAVDNPKPVDNSTTKDKTLMPADFGISDAVRAWAKRNGYTPWLDLHLEYFRDYAHANGVRYRDWDGAFRNSIRADWGAVRRQALAAARQQGRTGHQGAIGAPAKPWYLTRTGIERKALEAGMTIPDDPNGWAAMKAKVLTHFGVTAKDMSTAAQDWGGR